MEHQQFRLDSFIKQKYNFSREHCKDIILNGYVKVDQKTILKPSFKVCEKNSVDISQEAFPKYVSRGGLKMEKALLYFKIDLTNKICLDIGASTGGFSDCMLKNYAKRVYAVDVGSNQLDKSLLANENLISMENTDIRLIDKLPQEIDFISIDISFISLTKIINNAFNLLKHNGELVALIKPQFEAGKQNINKNGVVNNKNIHKKVLQDIYYFFQNVGFSAVGVTFSPITGGKGNIEYLMYLKKSSSISNIFDFNKIISEAFQKLK